jgi:endonuclease/exonuclease/phosphatase family metal-dependent hydrolase
LIDGKASVKGNASFRRLLQPEKLRELKLHVASFNISISTQLNKLVGSERDFVHECQVLKQNCFENGVHAFSRLDALDVLALQEVELPNAEYTFQMSQPTLNRTMRGSVEDAAWDTNAHCSILWNSNVLGECIWSRTLATEPGRPCLQVVVEKDGWRVLLMTLSAPHMTERAHYDSFTAVLSKNVPDLSVHDVILMGDFNDHGVFISSDAPLRFGPFEVSQGLNEEQIRRELITCCWHKEDQTLNPNRYPSMTEAGDYILAENVTEQRIPMEFAKNNDVPFASDHLPVEATVVLRSG